MGSQKTSLKVLMLPWLAHGHISPFLELAKKLSDRNFHVYLCSTPINLSSIKEKVTGNYSLSIQLVELDLPSLPELPPHYHTTNGLPTHLNATLSKAFEMSSPNFSKILETLNPDVFIGDLLQPWADKLASSYNIPVVHFVTSGAATVSYFCNKKMHPDVEFPFPAVYLSDSEFARIARSINSQEKDTVDKDGNKKEEEKLRVRFTDLMLIKTSEVIEEKYLKYFSALIKRKVLTVGPLVQNTTNKDHPSEVIEWLGKKDQSSTVFVSFGSAYFLSKEEIEELAHGLELSSVNFIWVIRFPVGEETKVEEVLPEGFIDRVRERGMIIKGWAPQAMILGHPSVGGFVSHCGWGSMMESMRFGAPIIAMPIQLDQPLNARFMVELGVAREVTKDQEGRFHREEIVKVIREVVVEGQGDVMRRTAIELSEKIRLNEEKEIDGAIEELAQICQKRKG